MKLTGSWKNASNRSILNAVNFIGPMASVSDKGNRHLAEDGFINNFTGNNGDGQTAKSRKGSFFARGENDIKESTAYDIKDSTIFLALCKYSKLRQSVETWKNEKHYSKGNNTSENPILRQEIFKPVDHVKYEGQSHAMVKKFLQDGHCEIDTAIMYVNGETEKILGKMLEVRDASQVSIATKANPGKGFSYDGVKQQMKTSLESLQVSCVDIFYLHWPDHKLPVEETLRAANDLYKEGKYKRLGLSNYKSWQVVEICAICKANGWIMPTVYQGMYNAFTRDVERELFPALRKYGLRFYVYNPLAGGLLTGRYKYEDVEQKQPRGRFFGVGGKWAEAYRNRFWKKSFFDGVDLVTTALNNAYGEGNVTVLEASLRWLSHHSKLSPEFGDGVIIGASKPEHVESNLKALKGGPLHEDVVEAFEKAWSGIKGDCPDYFR